MNARILGTTKGPKIDIFTYKSKTGSRRRMGHRQKYTTLEVTSIDLGSSGGMNHVEDKGRRFEQERA